MFGVAHRVYAAFSLHCRAISVTTQQVASSPSARQFRRTEGHGKLANEQRLTRQSAQQNLGWMHLNAKSSTWGQTNECRRANRHTHTHTLDGSWHSGARTFPDVNLLYTSTPSQPDEMQGGELTESSHCHCADPKEVHLAFLHNLHTEFP